MAEFIFISKDASEKQQLENRRLAIAGWTGRDAKSVQAHIDELAALGVPAPVRTPLIYKVASSLLTTRGQIEVLGEKTSGEAEFVLLRHQGETWVGIGSDHTCRQLEVTSVPASKQVCGKPIGNTVWLLRDLQNHWDHLELRSYTVRDGVKQVYQQSKVHHILTPDQLLGLCLAEGVDLENSFLFCGTVPLSAPWCSAEEFICELHDPILERSINCRYQVHQLG
jgi:hypothetical protein